MALILVAYLLRAEVILRVIGTGLYPVAADLEESPDTYTIPQTYSS